MSSPAQYSSSGGQQSSIQSRPKLSLIFPPAVHPTSPPLGVACLKAFLQTQAVPGRSRIFDLNLAYYNQALRWIGDGRLKMKLRKWDQATTARNIADACDFFQGRYGPDAFADLSSFNRHASLYQDFSATLNGLFEYFARRFIVDLPIPSLADRYFRELLAPVLKDEPDLVGFSILFSQQLYFALAMAKYLKEKKGISVVLGGATLSVMPEPEKLLAEPVPILIDKKICKVRLNPLLDFLVKGEGETSLCALIKHWDEDFSGVPGLVFEQNGHVKSNPPDKITDLNQLPLPDFDDLCLSDYHSPLPVLPYLASRGCFWQRCAFCTHRKTYLTYREETVERTADHLCALRDRYGVKHFNLVDEMIHPRRFRRLSRAMSQKGPGIHYSAYAKPTAGFDRPLSEELYRSGLRVLMWGIESGNQRVLDLMRKGTHVEDMERVLEEAHQAGIRNLIFLMFGFPSETRSEWEDTLNLLEKHKDHIDALSKSRFLLLPGSDIFRCPEHYHISRIIDHPARDPISIAYDYQVVRGLSQEEVRESYQKQLPLLRRYGRSPYFAVFRDHFLLYASICSKATELPHDRI